MLNRGKKSSHTHSRSRISYPVSLGERLYSLFASPVVFLIAAIFIGVIFFGVSFHEISPVPVSYLLSALAHTLGRLSVAYVFALIISVPLALMVTSKPWAEKVFLPFFDILESVPTLAFFPLLILFFIKLNLLDVAAIVILFLSMVWNIVFTAVGGLKIIPKDIKSAATVFNINGFSRVSRVLLPAIFPELVTGSILAVAQGWNIIIVAEVLHTYIPGGTSSQDLFGLGSILVNAIASGQNVLFFLALALLVLTIAALNFFVWQKLLQASRRYKFE